jgi:ribonucleoside-diphosphate reductase alpha chain
MPVSPNEIVIDLGRDALLSVHAIETLQDRYMIEGETSPQHAFARAAAAFADDAAHAQRLYDYASKGWFMFATPLLSNGGTTRGLPISCFLNYMDDSREGINEHYKETSWLSSLGGGVGGYIGVRGPEGTSKGSASSGGIPFVCVLDRYMLAFSQGKTRRGSYAAYLDISHPEIDEFLQIRKPSGGDANRKALNLHHAVNLTDEFMMACLNDADWNLVSPKTGEVKKTVSARALMRKIVETRHQTGEPFILFSDTANRALPEPLKRKGLKINHSNLCTEIMLPTAPDRTAVCCLSSVNVAAHDEWKDDPLFIEDLMRMLDNCLEDFIRRAPPELWRAVNSAKAERSVGLGAMGLQTFFQDRMIAWDSDLARAYNVMIFESLAKKTTAASLKLGAERGEAPDMEGTGHRFAHRMAVAPNASSSIFVPCGPISPSIEQFPENIFIHKTLSGSHKVRNPALERLLEAKGKNTDKVWKDILANDGSVQHLSFLSDDEKKVFLTAFETDQRATIQLNNDRTPHVDQGISLNISVPSNVDAEYFLELHFLAWAGGSKSMYYVRSKTLQKAENMNTKVEQMELVAPEPQECLACEG